MNDNKKGFTLIEVLVVTIIIVVLAIISAAAFRNISRQAYITKGKVEVKSIASALEKTFNPESGYQVLFESNFALGSLPIAPPGTYYLALLSSNPDISPAQAFKVCANLSQASPCTEPSCYCYCISSGQGSFSDTFPYTLYHSP